MKDFYLIKFTIVDNGIPTMYNIREKYDQGGKYMKKILLALVLVISLLFSSCEFLDTLQSDSSDVGANSGGVAGGGNSSEGGESSGGSTSNDTGGNTSSSGSDNTGNNGSGNAGNDNSDGSSTENGSGNIAGGNDGTVDGGSDGIVLDPASHTDEDNDGVCDDCKISVLVELDFYVMNDLHGKFTDGTNHPGVDELTTFFKNVYNTEDNVLLISSGDMWQGGSESNLTKGLIITDWMNELDFVSMTLGNHEFDWSDEYIKINDELAEFPFLAINVFDRNTNKRVDYAKSSIIIERGGVKIGIIGAIGDCYSSISSDKVGNVYFKVGDELTALVKAESEKLRDDGVDLIIYSIHDGYGTSGGSTISDKKLESYYDPSLSKGDYVDIVFEGHTHQDYVLKDAYGVYHIQTGGENKAIAHAEIMYNYVNGKYVVTESQTISNTVYSTLVPDSIVSELLKKYEKEISAGDEVLGVNAKKRSDKELEQLVADLYLETGLKKWGGQYNIFLAGGFLRTRSPYNLDAGEVKYSDLEMLFPFENEIVLCSIKGKDLKNNFINTTNSDYYISKSSYGKSVSTINNNETYYVVVDMYTAVYAKNNLTIIETYDTVTFAKDLLKAYIKKGGLSK